jgi:hypothetical protein
MLPRYGALVDEIPDPPEGRRVDQIVLRHVGALER